MPTPKLVERVARALAKFGWSVENPVFDDWFNRPEIQETYLEQAQAALKAHEEWREAARKRYKYESKAIGGYARAAKLSPERRSEIARQAARARWSAQP